MLAVDLKGEEKKEEGENFSRIERIKGSFYRRFTLPNTADGEKISANMRHGVLEIIIPKKKTAALRKIKVKQEKE